MSPAAPTELDTTLATAASARGLLARTAIDMAGLSDALLQQLGGVSGWSGKYKDLFDKALAAGNYRVAADLLKMVPDTMERASKAGSRAIEDLSDSELEQAAVGILARAMQKDPSIALALSKDAQIIEIAKESVGAEVDGMLKTTEEISNEGRPSGSHGADEDQRGDEGSERGGAEGLRPDSEAGGVPSFTIERTDNPGG